MCALLRYTVIRDTVLIIIIIIIFIIMLGPLLGPLSKTEID